MLLEDGKLFFDLACGVCLDEANHGANGHLWWDRDEKVNMVSIMVRLFEIELRIIFRYLEEFPIQVFPEFRGDHSVTVFGRKDDVIITQIDAVIVPAILLFVCHPFMISV